MDRLMELIELKKYAEALKLFPALECEVIEDQDIIS